ncbi:MAG: hypothetical protein ACTSRP_17410 [Candidatus Helarchaeota archaeon]
MKAQALFIILITLGMAMSVSLIFSTLNIERLHTMVKIGNSVKAFYAAESGINCQIYKDWVIRDNGFDCSSHMHNGTDYSLEVTVNATGETEVKSTGESKGVYRKIHIAYELP